MFRTVVLCSIVALVSSQYPRQRAPPQRPPPEYDAEPDYDDYQPRAAPPPPRPQPRPSINSVRLRPASVHYVNIGAELAGDYKFGYDTGKGDDGQSFREETRLPDGTVQGAYGYVDETGKQHIVKYTAGKDGFRVLKDNAEGSSRSAPAAQPAPAYNPPPPAARAPAYVPPPQPARAPMTNTPPSQPARSYAPQSPRQPPAQEYAPRAEPTYRAPPQPAYRPPPPPPQRSYAPVPQSYAQPRSRSRESAARQVPEPARRRVIPEAELDYDYPDNDIQERRLVVVDTTLFNYNIGTNKNKK